MAGSQTDLVAVGRIARRCSSGQLPLGQLAGYSILQRDSGIAAAGNTHGLMDIGTAGQRIPDAAADTGSCAAERLDLRGMVMGFVLEHQQPVLLFSIHHRRNMDGAGVDFLALIQLRQKAPFFQSLGTDGGDVHQRLRTLGGLLLTVNLHPGIQIALIGFLNRRIIDLGRINKSRECGVTAVVRPIGVHHPDFCDGGITMLLISEVCLQELQIVGVHGKSQLIQQGGKGSIVHSGKALHRGNGFRSGILNRQGLRLLQRSLSRLYSVDNVILNCLHILL